MKKYHSIITLIIITAALIGLGLVAFKYLRNSESKNDVKIQTSLQNLQQQVQKNLSSPHNSTIPTIISSNGLQQVQQKINTIKNSGGNTTSTGPISNSNNSTIFQVGSGPAPADNSKTTSPTNGSTINPINRKTHHTTGKSR
jgi:Tfp pilus assembly protein PilV